MSKKQKFIVLFALFIVPLLFYIFLQLGTHNFGKLPVVVENILDVSHIDKNYSFENKVSVVLFLGDNVTKADGELFNLNEKVYKKFYGYTDFQLIALVAKGQEDAVEKLKKRMAINTNLIKWNFIFCEKKELSAIFEGLKTTYNLDANSHSSKAFIIDKEVNLRRGKSTIKAQENEKLLGYNMKSISELKDDMHDDIKVVLAEYSFALKKNSSEDRRKESISNEKK
ncbi:hypothetical protein [Tenacibaculum sp. SG-28]|uniref:hypothetical protein n=1 Tax=Tenacibaculum sp. SG-28 TaxID=754426 RepID=UPI000CF3FF04|nr:hypothetical protein [Tenacibaculum sp. SG-28]PQJ21218.1 hypothetical protein BSU00_09580 [Tenacibaculum sp. SG-28]